MKYKYNYMFVLVTVQVGETALHPAAKEGLLPVVQNLCAFGCTVDLLNKVDFFTVYPLPFHFPIAWILNKHLYHVVGASN